MTGAEIRKELYLLQDEAYREFQAKLIPGMGLDQVIGVRTPLLRKLARQIVKEEDTQAFLEELPHEYFDETQLHAFVISEIKDPEEVFERTELFLPYVNNWATCDQLSPKVFRKCRKELLKRIEQWLASGRTYTVRFGIGMLMQHFLDEAFDPKYPAMVSEVRSEEYYVNMMIAWYFATALAKQYETVLPYIEKQKLDPWTHNKTIQKAVESYRITPQQKEYLKTLKVKTR